MATAKEQKCTSNYEGSDEQGVETILTLFAPRNEIKKKQERRGLIQKIFESNETILENREPLFVQIKVARHKISDSEQIDVHDSSAMKDSDRVNITKAALMNLEGIGEVEIPVLAQTNNLDANSASERRNVHQDVIQPSMVKANSFLELHGLENSNHSEEYNVAEARNANESRETHRDDVREGITGVLDHRMCTILDAVCDGPETAGIQDDVSIRLSQDGDYTLSPSYTYTLTTFTGDTTLPSLDDDDYGALYTFTDSDTYGTFGIQTFTIDDTLTIVDNDTSSIAVGASSDDGENGVAVGGAEDALAASNLPDTVAAFEDRLLDFLHCNLTSMHHSTME